MVRRASTRTRAPTYPSAQLTQAAPTCFSPTVRSVLQLTPSPWRLSPRFAPVIKAKLCPLISDSATSPEVVRVGVVGYAEKLHVRNIARQTQGAELCNPFGVGVRVR